MEENQPTKKTFNPIIVAATIASVIVVTITIGVLSTKKDAKPSANPESAVIETPISALQRSQRDTQRKNEASRVQSAINSYRANNRGRYPQTEDQFEHFKDRYLQESELDLSVKLSEDLGDSPSHKEIKITPNSQCEDDNIIFKANKFTVTVGLEGGSVYCLDV